VSSSATSPRCSGEAATGSDVAKIAARLTALGISDVDMAEADATAVQGCTLSLLAQELVNKVPAKVCHPA